MLNFSCTSVAWLVVCMVGMAAGEARGQDDRVPLSHCPVHTAPKPISLSSVGGELITAPPGWAPMAKCRAPWSNVPLLVEVFCTYDCRIIGSSLVTLSPVHPLRSVCLQRPDLHLLPLTT